MSTLARLRVGVCITTSQPRRQVAGKKFSKNSEAYDYGRAQRDEVFRLVYLGTTRGRRRVFWFGDKAESVAKQLLNSGMLT